MFEKKVVVEVFRTKVATYKLCKTSCGKKNCACFTSGLLHGPYWYAEFYKNGRLVHRYIGRNFALLSFDHGVRLDAHKKRKDVGDMFPELQDKEIR